ncbi:MAG: hypothetical protein KAI33_08445, partial [Elusimicrobiales bacterium]|nr:hypothetical protein [Elusimicrobiales bacterium]
MGAWNSLTSMTEPRYAHTMNVIGDYVYVIGGKDGANAKSNIWKAQIQTDGAISPWSAATSLPTPRYGHETITVGNNIYVSGGNNGTSAQNLVFQTNAASDASLNPWGSFASLSSVKQFHSGFAIGGKMYITGGTDGTLASSEVYLSSVTGTEYKVEVSLLSSFAALADESYWQSDYNWGFDSLIPNTTYYFRTKSRNWSLTESAYSDYISTLTYAAIPSTAPWTDVSVSSAVARWDFNNNPVGTTLFSCEISSHSDFSLIADSSDTYNDSALFTGLQPTTTYYGRVKAFNRTFNATRFIQLADIKTFFDPALDTSSPTITNNQTGDDIWRSTDTALYDIDFADTGGSEISKFQIMVATDSGAASGILASWTDVMTGMNTSSYSDDWQLPLSVFDAMIEGVTNYISVRVYDNVSNSSTTIDAFYVQKDTTPPVISVDYTAPVEYLSENPGPVSTVTFSDAVSKLYKTQYSISSNQLSADENILVWTDIGEPSGYSVFEATW